MSESDWHLFEDNAIKCMDSLYCKAVRLMGSIEKAEILVQQTYASAFIAFEQFDKDSDFGEWLNDVFILVYASLSNKNSEKFSTIIM